MTSRTNKITTLISGLVIYLIRGCRHYTIDPSALFAILARAEEERKRKLEAGKVPEEVSHTIG